MGVSALGCVRSSLGGVVPVWAVLTLGEVIEGLKEGVGGEVGVGDEEISRLEEYRARWRAVE